MIVRIVAFTFFLSFSMCANGSAADRYFTVRDSIEMTRFFPQDGGVTFSADGARFAVVTSRGIIASDAIESSVRVFSTRDVRAFLGAVEGTSAPPGKIVATISATPTEFAYFNYYPVITDVQWLNGTTIAFLAQDGASGRRVHAVDVVNRRSWVLTPPTENVIRAVVSGRLTLYEALPLNERVDLGQRINADAVDITGVPLGCLLFIKDSCSGVLQDTLWIAKDGVRRKVTDHGIPLRFLNYGTPILALSHDARWAIVLSLVDHALPNWGRYNPAIATLRIDPDDTQSTSILRARPLTQYSLVDVTKGTAHSLVGAPLGWNLGWAGRGRGTSEANWSPSGRRVLVTNTFLSLDGVDGATLAERAQPCAAVTVDIPSRVARCLIFNYHNSFAQGRTQGLLTAAKFGRTDEDVTLTFQDVETLELSDVVYHFDLGMWRSVPAHPASFGVPTRDVPLKLTVRQDLDVPPALWATETSTKGSKKLWDPNPFLARIQLGETTVFDWKDKSGYRYVGAVIKPPRYQTGKRYPLVIQTHGFSASEFMTDGEWVTSFAARALAASGFVVLQMPENLRHTDTAREVPDQIDGFKSAIERLDADGLIDPQKVGIIGFSRTSYHVEGALIAEPTLFGAASISDGVDFSYLQYVDDGLNAESIAEYNSVYGPRAANMSVRDWLKEAPGFSLDRVRTPLRIEAISPYSVMMEWETFSRLHMQGAPVDLVYYPKGIHLLQKPLERLASQQGNVDWFRFWLQGYEDPSPAKVSQYRRWRALRTPALFGTAAPATVTP